jgi:glycolate oxidase iron-sulfur subunit
MLMNKKFSKMKNLVQLMKSLDQQVSKCSRCGMCQSVCPLYEVTRIETDVARGKLTLLDGLMREFFADPNGVSERLNRCLLCGTCSSNCPRGVNIIEIFLNARAIITEYNGLSFLKKIIFRRYLSNPEKFDRTLELATKWQYLFSTKEKIELSDSCSHLISPLLSGRHIVPLAQVPFHKMDQPFTKKGDSRDIKVAFFIGCLLDKVFPKVANSIVNILRYHGAEIIIPASQGCCAIPALASGDKETFSQLLEYNLNLFDPAEYDYLVTGCATCTATIRKIWPAMTVQENSQKELIVNQVAKKTYDINEFLIKIIGVNSLKENQDAKNGKTNTPKPIITYHDPCHLRKTLDIHAEPRKLISTNLKYSFIEMTDAESCCGMGGSFSLEHYNLSTEIGRKKASSIESARAVVVATSCPACMMQLSDILKKKGISARVAHAAEIYAEKIL